MAPFKRQCADNFPEVEKIIRYEGTSLLLKSPEHDGKIVQAIRDCPGLTKLHLEVFNIDLEAAEGIGNALECQRNLKQIVLRNVFLPRHMLKLEALDEIRPAVSCLLGSVMKAHAQILVLDLRSNHLGSGELEGLWEFLASPSCHTLEELYLSSNSLHSEGARQLSEKMSVSFESSVRCGTPMKLRVFDCSFNGIGDEGAKFISKFLEKLTSLESVNFSNNDIGAEGITALSKALSSNTSLRDITVDGTSFSSDGLCYFSNCLPSFHKLETLSLAHCELESVDVLVLAAAFLHSCHKLKKINLRHNNIDRADALLAVIKNKKFLENVIMDHNKFTPEMEEAFNSKLFNIQRCVETMSSDDYSSLSSSSYDDDLE